MDFLVSYFQSYLHFSSPRWAVFSRVLAAIFGGYALATLSSIFINQLLLNIVGKYQAIHIGLLLTFLVYSFAAMWIFSVKTARKAWIGLLKSMFFCLVITWLLGKVSGVTN
jgi:hypothetical protein